MNLSGIMFRVCRCRNGTDSCTDRIRAKLFAEALGIGDVTLPLAPAIIEALQKAVGDKYRVVDETGTSMQELIQRYIDREMPVVFWACIDMKKEIIGPQWKLLDSGELFAWRSNEHCMLLVGYDEEGYYFNDPHENHGLIRYPKALVEERHKAQYEMACSMRDSL